MHAYSYMYMYMLDESTLQAQFCVTCADYPGAGSLAGSTIESTGYTTYFTSADANNGTVSSVPV